MTFQTQLCWTIFRRNAKACLGLLIDCRGKWKIYVIPMYDDGPIRRVATHNLLENSSKKTEVVGHDVQPVLEKDARVRTRSIFGSNMELDYYLRPYGIIAHGILNSSSNEYALSREAIAKRIQQNQIIEEAWRHSQAPYLDPESSPITVFPNQQDILMGHNKAIAMSWPGNIQTISEYLLSNISSPATIELKEGCH